MRFAVECNTHMTIRHCEFHLQVNRDELLFVCVTTSAPVSLCSLGRFEIVTQFYCHIVFVENPLFVHITRALCTVCRYRCNKIIFNIIGDG